jgi:murein DD-endopeptidase MepM/ murein hydrolase activator NlpD
MGVVAIFRIALIYGLFLPLAPQAIAAPPGLGLPVECEIGVDCLVQKLVDLNPGPGRRDYRCGTLTTEDHRGIDIRLRTLTDMRRGVKVLATASGTVLRIRDGVPDQNIRLNGIGIVGGQDAGNAVVIGHGDGWETQYSHLRQGSVAVKIGDKVKSGDVLGLIGMSGNAEFPHLHFDVRNTGNWVDPFLNAIAPQDCLAASDPPPRGLWSVQAAKALKYTPTAIITAGFVNARPEALAVRNAVDKITELPVTSTALVFWVDVSGVKIGDVERMSISGPDPLQNLSSEKTINQSALSWFSFSGKQKPENGWRAGDYRADYQLLREGKTIATWQADVKLVDTPK